MTKRTQTKDGSAFVVLMLSAFCVVGIAYVVWIVLDAAMGG